MSVSSTFCVLLSPGQLAFRGVKFGEFELTVYTCQRKPTKGNNQRNKTRYTRSSTPTMNLALLDPFSALKEFPESLTNTLSFGHSVFVKYNHTGDYLASGLSNGTILIIDNDTKSVIRQLKGHSRSVQSLCWSKSGKYLLSSSRDWQTLIWDLETDEIVHKFNFNSPIWSSEFNPNNENEFIASVYDDVPRIVNFKEGTSKVLDEDSKILISIFHPDGDLIFTGNNKGVINIISRAEKAILLTQKFTNSGIKNIVISSNGRKMAINSTDRIIRQINLPDFKNQKPEFWELEVEHKYQDLVNRLQWNSISFNSNSEFLIASAFGSAHCIYVWETTMGSLVKILEGPKEELVDIEWNQNKCIICSTGADSGTIYLWSIVVPQKWSALAPDFVEIEENINYDEKEDEFDIAPEGELNQKQLDEEDEYIDILTKETKDARGNEIRRTTVIPIDHEKFRYVNEYE